ncbi:MAG: hypothetical protein DRQ64_08775 [Gammaproteobacteria bacterium]|nr:MAG: hypothetical protein DRQ64_08775 [Gammaproteobacteria bacterium]
MKNATNDNSFIHGASYLPEKKAYIVFLVIVAIASLLRIYHLDSQMWLDEYSTILLSLRRPWLDLVSGYAGPASHILFEVLANWSSSLFGESAWSIRLPAALFGIAGVAMLARFATRIYTVKSGLFIAALMALSYNHIFFSQDARGYTTLIFFFLWSSYLFLQIVESGQMEKKTGILYCLATVLTCYCQPFGVFVPASQSVIALALVVINAKTQDAESFPIKQFILWMIAAALITLLFYAPKIDVMLEHAQMNVDTPAEGPRFNIGLVIEIIEGLSAAFFGYVGLTIVSIAGAIGIIIWIRSNAVSFFILTLPIVIQGIVFFIMGFGIHPRYFAIAIPVIYVAGGITIFYLSGALLAKFVSSVTTRQFVHSVVLSLIVLVSAYPLIRYYSIPKQDYEGVLAMIEKLSAEEDVRAGVQTVGSIMKDYYEADWVRIETLDDLLAQENTGKHVWVSMTLERIMALADPTLVKHIHEHYRLVKSFPGTVGNGNIQVYSKID